MKDLIDRQAAIDVVTKHYRAFDNDLLELIAYELGQLPSIQPEPCEDAVSRQRLLSDLKELTAAWGKYPVMAEQIKGVETAIGYVETIPSVTPERPKGKWIPVTRIYKATEDEFPDMHIEWVDSTEPDEIDGLRCSECGTIYDFTEARNWCSECGADMREDNNGRLD